jgi:NAD(P)-dependent dehydrogenase (short-subunit alcohol dehydrogenase family)
MLNRSPRPAGEGPGLTVNGVTPGYVATDMVATIPDKVQIDAPRSVRQK